MKGGARFFLSMLSQCYQQWWSYQHKPGEVSQTRRVSWGHQPWQWVLIAGEFGYLRVPSEALSVLINQTGPQDAPRHWESVSHIGQSSRCWIGLPNLSMTWDQILSLGHVLDVASWFQRPGIRNVPRAASSRGALPGVLHTVPWQSLRQHLGPDSTSLCPLAQSAPYVNTHLPAKVNGSPAALDQIRTYLFAFESLT